MASAGMSRVDLYRAVIRAMVRGGWNDSDSQIPAYIRLIQRLAWNLFFPNPARAMFKEEECHDAAREALTYYAEDWTPRELLSFLQGRGILVRPYPGAYSFLHRTFLEYLSAEEVAVNANRTNDLTAIDPYLWRRPQAQGPWQWTPAAAEMLRLLAGCLDKPELLLHRLRPPEVVA